MKNDLLSASVQNRAFRWLVFCLIFICSVSYCAEEMFDTFWDRIMMDQSRRRLSEGGIALSYRDYGKARDEFLKAVAANPEDYRAHRMLGISYYWLGEVNKAVESYKTALGINPNDYESRMVLGIAYAWMMDIQSAADEFEEVIRLKPDRADAHMNLGSAYHNLGMLSKALSFYSRAVRLDPKNPLYHFQLGLIYRALERYADAKDSYAAAIRYFPYYEDAYLEYGAVLEKEGDYKEAIKKYRTAVRIKRGDLVAHLKLAIGYLKSGDYANAARFFERSMELNPVGDQSRLAMDISFGGAEKKDKTDMKDGLDAFGSSLRKIPLNQEAEVDFEIVLKKEKFQEFAVERSTTSVYYSPGGVRYRLGLKPEDSLQRGKKIDRFLERIIQDSKNIPADIDAQINMVVNYGGKSDEPASGTPDSAASRPGPASKKSKAGRLVYQPRNVGNDMGLWVMGSYWVTIIEDTINDLRDILKSEDQHWQMMLGLAISYLQIGRVWDALDVLNVIDKYNPDEYLIKQAFLVAYVELGEWDLAEQKILQMLSIRPNDRRARNLLKILKEEK